MTRQPGDGSFGDAAGRTPDEIEVEVPVTGASAPAGDPADDSVFNGQPDTSGVSNLVEEGGPLEPQDLIEVEGEPSADPVTAVEAALAERTLDLQRLQAEYANYRKRVERDRQVIAENATYKALTPIIDVLDTIDRAREHGDLDPGFRSVADQLERVVAQQGLLKFGTPGDPFDPSLHEALSHLGEDPDVTVTTCKVIAKAGYKIGDRVVRAAQVLVVEPADG